MYLSSDLKDSIFCCFFFASGREREYATCNDADVVSAVTAMTGRSLGHAGAGRAERMLFGRTRGRRAGAVADAG